jgi:hypothetical protein
VVAPWLYLFLGLMLKFFCKFTVVMVAAVPIAAFADHGAGRVTEERATQIQSRFQTAYGPAHPNQAVFAGDGVRTLRRGFADIRFADSSEIRLNERTDLVIEDSNTMRRYALSEGAMWVRVAKGVRTVVRTPVGTATARGTVFVINAEGVLTVLEGTVEFEVNGVVTSVHAGQSVTFSPKTGTFTNVPDPYTVVQMNTGLTSNGWFDYPGDMTFTSPGDMAYLDSGAHEYYPEETDLDGAGVDGYASPFEVLAGLGGLAGGALLANGVFFPSVKHSPTIVPEPALPMAIGIGSAVFAFRRRRRAR